MIEIQLLSSNLERPIPNQREQRSRLRRAMDPERSTGDRRHCPAQRVRIHWLPSERVGQGAVRKEGKAQDLGKVAPGEVEQKTAAHLDLFDDGGVLQGLDVISRCRDESQLIA